MRARPVLLAVLTVIALVGGSAAASAGSAGPSPGAPGAGDPCFPPQGNGGYDVRTNGLDLRYDPATRRLDGTAAILATATQALSRFRNRIGDRAFFTVLRLWAAQHRYGHGTTAQFIALSERVSHRNLDRLLDAWLFTPGKPTFTR
jgi:hypothetical protein